MKTCFVVMGFNKKTDYQTGRTLDMDKSYRLLIKPTVQESGLECIRADEIVHSGVIDVPMYRHLLDCDLVIADLSTSNPNALYELGVRHALRPFSTIVIAESRLQYPFNVSHTAIRSYQHLGEAIDYEEVLRFRAELKEAIATIVSKQERDSPVYTYLPALKPPGLATGRGAGRGTTKRSATRNATPLSPAALVAQANEAIERDDYVSARTLLTAARTLRGPDRLRTADDDYVVQRLALATARSRTPDPVTALTDAQSLMTVLDPAASHDPETLRLWGETAAALWNETHGRPHLEGALLAYERAFCLRNDFESGVTLAFLLNVRASLSDPAPAIADFVQARRMRERVIGVCLPAIEKAAPSASAPSSEDARATESSYRLLAALAEAYLGTEDRDASDRWREEAMRLQVAQPLKDASTARLVALSALLAESPLRFLTM